jgi:transcriptional regulator with XRE-family HTH domain
MYNKLIIALEQEMERQEVSKAILARRCGMAGPQVTRVFNGENATVRTFKRFAEALGCEWDVGLSKVQSEGEGM